MFRETIAQYRSGSATLDECGHALFAYIGSEKISAVKPVIEETVLFTANDKASVRIVKPSSMTLDTSGLASPVLCVYNADGVLCHDESKALLYTSRGTLATIIEMSEKEQPLKAAAIAHGTIYFYAGTALYSLPLPGDGARKKLPAAFPSPFPRHYQGKIIFSETMCAVIRGAAGLYHASVFNTATGKMVAENISLASRNCLFTGNRLVYFSGTTGNWSLVSFDVITKKKTTLATFDDIITAELFDDHYIVGSSTGLRITPYGGAQLKIPFQMVLMGKYQGHAVLFFRGKTFISNTTRLVDGLTLLKGEVPELF
jgi:hypothetical protein